MASAGLNPVWEVPPKMAKLSGIKTTFSCDGHGRNLPRVELNNSTEARIAAWLLTATGINVHAQNKNLLISGRNSGPRIPSQQNFDRKQLLDIAEWLHDNMGELTETVKTMRLIPLPRLVSTPMQTSVYRRPLRCRI